MSTPDLLQASAGCAPGWVGAAPWDAVCFASTTWAGFATAAASHGTAALSAGAVVTLAWALDARFGEPPNGLHPVAGLGWLLGGIGPWLLRCPPAGALAGGAAAWLVVATLLATAATAAQAALAGASGAWQIPAVAAAALLLKPCFAWRMLRDEVAAVEQALQLSLHAGRTQVARLASREVSRLDEHGVRETALETLAENLNDSVVAPLFWYVVAGLPGAVVYRFANTADAMWGYRGRWEWAGKWAARADDLLSWLPARLTALVLAPGCLLGAPARLQRQAALTPSPNGGWPMAALALRLGVRLRKPGVYALNATAPSPSAADTAHALRLATRAARWAAALAVAGAMLRSLLSGLNG